MKQYLTELFEKTSHKLEYLGEIAPLFSVPNNSSFGDLSTNTAMLLTKKLRRNPREIAAEIVAALEYDSNVISKIEIAPPGFINFFFSPGFVASEISEILEQNDEYGKSKKYAGKRALVEFVSANPTGPLTVGHGRNAVYGDTVANMLEFTGYTVEREFYFNNAGRQMRVLGDSVKYRYLELLGDDIQFPEDYYQGEYIKEIAAGLVKEYSDTLRDEFPEGIFKATAEREIFKDINSSLAKLQIRFDNYFNENDLYESGRIKQLLEHFSSKGMSYEKDGAVWLRLSELGNEADKVIVKSTGEPTYRLPDIAYHMTKFERGYDLMVDIFGSDHNATYPDVMAALKSMGFDDSQVKVLIYQFVTVMNKGEVVKMSTRKANYITLDELVEEVGKDVVRYFFNMRSASSHLNFDLELAKTQSDENPVFYLQYAHARICSILKMTSEQGLTASVENLHLLDTPEEQNLIKKMHSFGEEMLYCAESFESHRITAYLEELAALFHRFYKQCRILGSEKALAEARIALAIAARTVIRNGLAILGVDAPEKM